MPITRVSNTFVAIAVPVGMPVKSLAELVAMARTQPGKLNWAGVTGALDFMFAGWLKNEQLAITKVPYRNPVDAAKDLAEGRVQVYEAALAIVRPQLDSRQDQAARRDQHAAHAGAAEISDRAGSRLPGADDRRPGRPVRAARHAARASPDESPSDFRAVADTTIKDRLAP